MKRVSVSRYPRPEIYTYTFPEHAIFSGTCNGAGSGLKYYYPDLQERPRREDTMNRVFLLGYRFDILMGSVNRQDPSVQYLRRLIGLRHEIKADLYASEFRDEIGLGALPQKVHARLFRRRDGGSLTVNLVDRRSGSKPPITLQIELAKHGFSQPGEAVLFEFDGRRTDLKSVLLKTPLRGGENQGTLMLGIPPLTGEVAAIVLRRKSL